MDAAESALCFVVGARPNFMKMAPVILEARRRGRDHFVVHTGQHYDRAMSEVFFHELGMPEPDIHLGVGSGSHAAQTARILVAFEAVMKEKSPALVLVGGDVNSTLACALTAAKMGIPVGHVEAGLRSFDRSMPEEINRVLTDHVSELLFTTEESGNRNLAREGVDSSKVHFVGNCMIDSLRMHVESAVDAAPWGDFGLSRGAYGVVTLHRPSLVDSLPALREVLSVLKAISTDLPLIFPVHPRTMTNISRLGLDVDGVRLTEPLGYKKFLGLLAGARLVMTDSGGIQEETTALGVPCLTLRDNTERPVTIERGLNRLVGRDPSTILREARALLEKPQGAPVEIPLWDGMAAHRTMDVIDRWFASRAGTGQGA
jgi:UDP-N-acetylglucosamine 2-epimerase (non-hydrolysing)